MFFDPRATKIKRYFLRFPWRYTLWMSLFIGWAIGWLIQYDFGPGLAIPVIPAVFLSIPLLAWWGKPADAEMDRFIRAEIEAAKPRALEKCCLDEKQTLREPAVFIAMPPPERKPSKRSGIFCKSILGQDQNLRFTPLCIVVINFTEHQLVNYCCTQDLVTKELLSEETSEFYYHNIVAVGIESKYVEEMHLNPFKQMAKRILEVVFHQGRKVRTQDILCLTNSGGKTIAYTVNERFSVKRGQKNSAVNTMLDDAIKAIRKMLREKKSN